MPQAAIFDVDGTLVDSVDFHASAWQEALAHFGHHATFEQCRSQIGKGGDQLIPVFLSRAQQRDHGKEMEEWRGKLFKSKYLPLVRPFSAVPELLRRLRETGLKVAVASSAKTSELDVYLEIACVRDLVDIATSSEDAEQSKPAPDIFQVALKKLGIAGPDAVAIGDTPYDAEAAGKAETRPLVCCAAALPSPPSVRVVAFRCILVPLGFSPASWLPPWHPARRRHRNYNGSIHGLTGSSRLLRPDRRPKPSTHPRRHLGPNSGQWRGRRNHNRPIIFSEAIDSRSDYEQLLPDLALRPSHHRSRLGSAMQRRGAEKSNPRVRRSRSPPIGAAGAVRTVCCRRERPATGSSDEPRNRRSKRPFHSLPGANEEHGSLPLSQPAVSWRPRKTSAVRPSHRRPKISSAECPVTAMVFKKP